jgi:hypothetical protein
MTNEERNKAQDILDGLLRDAYSRGVADSKSESESIIKKLEEQNEKMLIAFRVLLQDMDNVDRVCDRAGVHPFTGMRSVIQSFVNEGEQE